MADRHAVAVYVAGPEESSIAREVLGAGARAYPGVLEGEADADGVERLIAAGLSVDRLTGPTSWVAPPDDWLGTGGPAPTSASASHAGRPRSRGRFRVGGFVGGLVVAAGSLVLLQQAALIDPIATVAAIGLAIGAAGGLTLTWLAGRRSS
jgi:hypothetical protein